MDTAGGWRYSDLIMRKQLVVLIARRGGAF